MKRGIKSKAKPNGRILFCPRCQKPVEATEYFSRGGLSDWRVESVGISIRCSRCSYAGLPLETTVEGYQKLARIQQQSGIQKQGGKR